MACADDRADGLPTGARPSLRRLHWQAENAELNALGLGYESRPSPRRARQRRDEAQVLFTTQAKFLHLSRFRRNFATNPNFHFRGWERHVRIWDESILPIDTMTISAEQIGAVAAELFKLGQDEAAKLTREFASELGEKPHDSIIQVPLLPIELGDEFVKACATLLALADCTVRVYRDEHSGSVAISFREALPRFLAPLLVLDANADKRAVYQEWAVRPRRPASPLFTDKDL